MALIKMKITVCSSVINEGDPIPERSEESYEGYMKYSDRDGVERISYKSVQDGAKTETLIEPRAGTVRLLRKGAIESEMLFEPGKAHSSLYRIPPFSFDMTVKTNRADCSLSPFGGEVLLEYEMTVGGAKKDCFMKIKAIPV